LQELEIATIESKKKRKREMVRLSLLDFYEILNDASTNIFKNAVQVNFLINMYGIVQLI